MSGTRIGFAVCDPGLSFGPFVGLGARDRAGELGVELSVVSVTTPQEHAQVVERFVEEGVDGLVVEALETDPVLPALEKARAAGIPVVLADMSVREARATCVVNSDNVRGGELAAAYLVERLGGSGLVVHLRGLLGSENGRDRTRGFRSVVERGTGIEVVEMSTPWAREAGAKAMREALDRHPRVDGVFANNDVLALGAITALAEAGRSGEAVVVGFDALPEALVAIHDGAMDATVSQAPREMGRLAVEMAVRAAHGEAVPAQVTTPISLVTRGSVAEASFATLAAQAAISHANAVLYEGLRREMAERRRTEEALRESESRYRALVEEAADGIVIADDSTRITFANARACELLGYRLEELVGMPMLALYEDSPAAEAEFAQRLAEVRQGNTIRYERRARRKDGTLVPIEVSLRQLESGPIQAIYRDVTERQRAEEHRAQAARERELLEAELRQAQKLEAVGRLAGGVAHDFNNLLTVILGYSEVVLQRPASDAQVRASVAEIRRAAEKAEALTRHLLAFSRSRPAEIGAVEVNEVVSDMDRLLRRLIGADVELVTILSDGSTRVDCDRAQLEQVLLNLVVNARDAMPAGGKLAVETATRTVADEEIVGSRPLEPGRYVVLSVRDTGSGMDEATQARIFEPFFTTKGVGEGTGLGLSSVWGIIEQLGGRVVVESEPGRGSTFTIHLAASRRPVAVVAAQEPPPVTSMRGTERVLLVEDNETIRDLTARTLEEHGYHVAEAPYASAALERWHAEREAFEVLVTDVVMPGMSGVELAERVLAERPGTAVVLMSGYADQISFERLRGAAVTFLEKPFTQAELVRAIRETLARVSAAALRAMP